MQLCDSMPTDADLQLDEDDPPTPDYRAERMESAEGRGIASRRIMSFYESCADQDLIEAFPGRRTPTDPADEVVAEIAERALARAEGIGFWVVWHQAGGFKALEHAGWHRTTIFRKLRRFRATFGAHPDEWTCDWITLDLERYWQRDLDERLAIARGDVGSDLG